MAVKKQRSADTASTRATNRMTSPAPKTQAAERAASRTTSRNLARDVKPMSPGPFTFPARGGSFEIYVVYPKAVEACPYTVKSTVRWIVTHPRDAQFDAILPPNVGPSREGIVWVQGAGSPRKHRVLIRQMPAS